MFYFYLKMRIASDINWNQWKSPLKAQKNTGHRSQQLKTWLENILLWVNTATKANLKGSSGGGPAPGPVSVKQTHNEMQCFIYSPLWKGVNKRLWKPPPASAIYCKNFSINKNVCILCKLPDVFIFKVIATGALILCILAITDRKNIGAPKGMEPLCIGLTIMAIGVSMGLNCGYPINPARDLGPRLFTAVAGWGTEVFR